MDKPEEKARVEIDQALADAGWQVQSLSDLNIHAARGIAVREFPLGRGHGFADYLLYVNGKAVGAIEAKKKGETLTGVEVQTEKYSVGLPQSVPAYQRPLPFLYQSTGVETRFTNMLDPEPRSRRVFHFHQPETFVNWLEAAPITFERDGHALTVPSALRSRLQTLPPLGTQGLWPAQLKAVNNLEQSLQEDRPRALIQMATGSGKTFTAVTSAYRLIKHVVALSRTTKK
jgi:type I restriction enzyme R subunit